MRKLYYIIFATIACILTAGCGADSAMRKGDKFYALGEYFDAATQYMFVVQNGLPVYY